MTGIFDNDGAIDWLKDFTEHPEEVKMRSALMMTGDAENYPDALDCEEALAAAAVIVSLRKQMPQAGLPHDYFEKITDSGFKLKNDLTPTALISAKNILANSELKDLWEEDEEYTEWQLSVRELISLLENA